MPGFVSEPRFLSDIHPSAVFKTMHEKHTSSWEYVIAERCLAHQGPQETPPTLCAKGQLGNRSGASKEKNLSVIEF